MVNRVGLPDSPIAMTAQVIGGKWKILVLRDLMDRPWRFNELRRDLEGISQKVLAETLRALEADGLIMRTAFEEVPPHVEYSLTERGESLRPVLTAMEEWGRTYRDSLEEPSLEEPSLEEPSPEEPGALSS